MDIKLLNWNMRGLNNPAWRRSIQKFVSANQCNIVCLQETKLADVDKSIVAKVLGSRVSEDFVFKAANAKRGGILVASAYHFAISFN